MRRVDQREGETIRADSAHDLRCVNGCGTVEPHGSTPKEHSTHVHQIASLPELELHIQYVVVSFFRHAARRCWPAVVQCCRGHLRETQTAFQARMSDFPGCMLVLIQNASRKERGLLRSNTLHGQGQFGEALF
jgi:hypothetical protein